jgi:hypothetical protein
METNSSNNTQNGVFQSIAQLRDEIRLKVHLAGLDAKEKWQELEEQVQNLEHRVSSEGGSIVGATAVLARDLKQSLEHFRERLAH